MVEFAKGSFLVIAISPMVMYDDKKQWGSQWENGDQITAKFKGLKRKKKKKKTSIRQPSFYYFTLVVCHCSRTPGSSSIIDLNYYYYCCCCYYYFIIRILLYFLYAHCSVSRSKVSLLGVCVSDVALSLFW